MRVGISEEAFQLTVGIDLLRFLLLALFPFGFFTAGLISLLLALTVFNFGLGRVFATSIDLIFFIIFLDVVVKTLIAVIVQVSKRLLQLFNLFSGFSLFYWLSVDLSCLSLVRFQVVKLGFQLFLLVLEVLVDVTSDNNQIVLTTFVLSLLTKNLLEQSTDTID